MPIVCFMYRINNDPKTYFGKYVADYISDDHEGLDREVIGILEISYNIPHQTYKVGILSCSTNNDYLNYSSSSEYTFFDFYYVKDDNMHKTQKILYINGIKLKEEH